LAWVALVMLAGAVGVALAAPLLPLSDPHATDLSARLLAPLSPGHPLGTDALGRDLLARLVWGSRVSLAVAGIATAVAALLGSLLGLMAGYLGGLTDTLAMRGVDVLMGFPYLLLVLAIIAALGPGLGNAMLAIALANLPFFARAVRGATVSVKDAPYVEAARMAGASQVTVLFGQVLPNVMPTILVMMTTTSGWMMLETAGLSFLGLGAQPPTADLGSLLGDGRQFMTLAPHLAALPGLVILVLVIAVNLFGDGLRDRLDPRLGGTAGGSAARTPVDVAPAPAPAFEREGGEATPLLTVRGLTLEFSGADGPLRAVDGVDLDLFPGRALGLVGESGSGKSVTALALLSLVPAPGRVTAGSVHLDGDDLLHLPDRGLRRIRGGRMGYVAQDPAAALNPLLRVGYQVAEAVRAHAPLPASAARHRALELLAQVRLPRPRQLAGAYPHQLSRGMRQRAVIAAALAGDPELIIADEPTTALDVTTQAEVLALLDDLRRSRGAAMLFISHDLAVVSQVCDRALVMYAGRVVEVGPVTDLFDRPAHPYTQHLLACLPELGHADKALSVLPGEPSREASSPGCGFAPRCPRADSDCARTVPWREMGPGHRVRCLRPGSRSEGSE
jgi:peptide/nickel transport system permease protein